MLGAGFAVPAVAQDPVITRHPQSGLSAAGRTFTFDVGVSGTAPLAFQWLFNGGDVTDATNQTLVLSDLDGGDIGVYSVRVTNPLGSVVSSNASLSLITRQPRGGLAARGESFTFDVDVGGTGPFTFQWRRNAVAIGGATNPVLIRTNLAISQSGSYSVRVSNPDGSVISSSANLSVSTNAPRAIGIFAPDSSGCVETRLAGNGFENAVAFSLSYNTNLFANPVFQPDRGDATVQQDDSQLSNGLVGVVVQLPPGVEFEQGDQVLGQWCFDVISSSNLLHARLAATNRPVAITATNISGESMLLSAVVQPRLVLVDPAPALNLQSGLFEQRIEVGNASAVTQPRLAIGVFGLGKDSLTNTIRLYNAQSFSGIDTNLDGIAETSISRVQVPSLDPGEAAVLTMEYYVTDLLTVPDPQYVALTGVSFSLAPPRRSTKVDIRAARFVGDVFLVEFSTRSRNFLYYVQYASTPAQLTNAARVKTAFPAVSGTGSTVQWIDNGPPKTESPPVSGSRFYRVLEVEAP